MKMENATNLPIILIESFSHFSIEQIGLKLSITPLSPRRLGAKAGSEKETLTVNQLPSHTHPLTATTSAATTLDPVGNTLATTSFGDVYTEEDDPQNMSSTAITNVGGSRSHSNLMPFLCINFIIALFGIYPSRH